MKSQCELIKLPQLSGNKASIYTVIVDNDSESLFDKFINENSASHKSEIKSIINRLLTIGKETGARAHFFKENEGKPGDGVCAICDMPKSNLRLYCIRYGKQLVVLGNGGLKSKKIRAFQEDKKLEKENFFLRNLSKAITEKMKEKEIAISSDDLDFEGDLIIYEI